MVFSIIVPIFNTAKYLEQCALSVLKQSVNDFELILVNDGSTDNSLQICEELSLKDSRVKVIDKQNGGLVSARKAGILVASGDYIVSLDSDDYIADNALEILQNAIRLSHSDIIIYQGYIDTDGVIQDSNQPIRGDFCKSQFEEKILPYLIGGITTSVQWLKPGIVFKAVKRVILLDNLHYYADDVTLGEDLLISTPCMLDAGKITILVDRLYYYRQFPEQMTKGYKRNVIVNEELLMQQLLQVSKDKANGLLDKYILRHALEMSKSAVYNEVKYGKGKKKVYVVTQDIFASEMYKQMLEKLRSCDLTKKEKLFLSLLKGKCRWCIYMLAKVNFLLRG